MVLQDGHMLNVFYHIPDREVGFVLLARSLDRNGSLDRYRDRLAEHGLRGNGHRHLHGDGNRPRVLLGHELLAVVDELVFLGLLGVESVGCILRGSLRHLAFLVEVVVQVVNGRAARCERALIVRG